MRTYRALDFDVPADHEVKIKEIEKTDKSVYIARKMKRLWNIRVTEIAIVIGPRRLGKMGLKGWKSKGKRGHANENIVKIGYYSKKCLEDLRRVAITKTPVKDNQLLLV